MAEILESIRRIMGVGSDAEETAAPGAFGQAGGASGPSGRAATGRVQPGETGARASSIEAFADALLDEFERDGSSRKDARPEAAATASGAETGAPRAQPGEGPGKDPESGDNPWPALDAFLATASEIGVIQETSPRSSHEPAKAAAVPAPEAAAPAPKSAGARPADGGGIAARVGAALPEWRDRAFSMSAPDQDRDAVSAPEPEIEAGSSVDPGAPPAAFGGAGALDAATAAADRPNGGDETMESDPAADREIDAAAAERVAAEAPDPRDAAAVAAPQSVEDAGSATPPPPALIEAPRAPAAESPAVAPAETSIAETSTAETSTAETSTAETSTVTPVEPPVAAPTPAPVDHPAVAPPASDLPGWLADAAVEAESVEPGRAVWSADRGVGGERFQRTSPTGGLGRPLPPSPSAPRTRGAPLPPRYRSVIDKIAAQIKKLALERLERGEHSLNRPPPQPAIAEYLGLSENASRRLAAPGGGASAPAVVEVGSDGVLELTPGMRATAEAERDALLTEASQAAAMRAIEALTDPKGPAASSIFETAKARPTLADGELDAIARDAVQPLLVEWLNAHLPALVEQIVREEMARVRRSA